jgi:hypothetical protein
MDALIDLELERAFAMSRAWDDAADALKRAINTGSDEGLDECDHALARFWELEEQQREAADSLISGRPHNHE